MYIHIHGRDMIMTRQEIARAGELLQQAGAETAATAERDRLTDLASQLDGLATGDRGPDHGRIARIQAALDEIQPAVEDEPAVTIENARDELISYRETLDGV